MRKNIFSCIIIGVCFILVTSCSSSSGNLPDSLSDTVAKACSAADFSNVTFNYKSDAYSEEVLMYMYGVENENDANAIEDFVLSERSGMSASTFSIIKFKSGTPKSIVDSVKTAIEGTYVQSLINALMPYDPTQYEIAKNYQFKTIGDSLVLVIHEKADEVFDAIVK